MNHISPPEKIFPLVRQISFRISPNLIKAGFTPNQITLTGLIAGLCSAIMFAQGTHGWGISGAILWAVCSFMDYCDGEVARYTGKTSRFGRYLDDVVDWIVHAALFTGLGIGAEKITGDNIWLWFGLIAAAGSTMNAWMNWLREWKRKRRNEIVPRVPGKNQLPESPEEHFLYVFRGLFRADFWLLIIVLEIFHITWLLLPVFAIGTQIFWITGFLKGADRFVP